MSLCNAFWITIAYFYFQIFDEKYSYKYLSTYIIQGVPFGVVTILKPDQTRFIDNLMKANASLGRGSLL